MKEPKKLCRMRPRGACRRVIWNNHAMRTGFTIVVVASLATFFAWCFLKDPFSFPWALGTLCLLTAGLAVPSIALGYWGVRRRHSGKRGAVLLIAIAAIGGICALVCDFVWFRSAGPFHEGIIAHGVAPDGREYVVSQAWLDWFDGYEIRLFIRDKDGDWRSLCGNRDWHPNETIEVVFDAPDGIPRLRALCGKNRIVEWLFTERDSGSGIKPSTLTLADLHSLHREELANRRRN